ncbi:MAG: dipeptidase [Anaerolineaceae bacterium]|nr:dipeptidase [Anaerolineaceae bacterium]
MNDFPIVFDGHNDTLLRYLRDDDGFDFFARNELGHLDLPRAREGGLGGGFFAVFVPANLKPRATVNEPFTRGNPPPQRRGEPLSLEYSQRMAFAISAQLFRMERQSAGALRIARCLRDVEEDLANDVFSAIFHLEGAEPLDPELDALEIYHAAGLRSLGIVWSRSNCFAHGVPIGMHPTPDIGPGLTEEGFALVRACNELGILIDLSHLNEAGFWDVARVSQAPLVATHSNVHALCPNARNLTDRQLDAIAASDGIVGLNFAVSFLHPEGSHDTAATHLETMVRHIDHLVERIGIDRVALGSDYDGTDIPDVLGDVSGLPKLMAALRASGYGDEELKKIAHENWIRVLRLTWKN